MNRLTLLLLPVLLLLAACAPTRDFTAAALNQTFGALDLVTVVDTPEGVAVTITPPVGVDLERVRLDLEAIGPLSVDDEACKNSTESVVICSWAVLVSPVTVTYTGQNVSGLTEYRVPGESERRWEFIRF